MRSRNPGSGIRRAPAPVPLVMRWGWLPVPALDPTRPLPPQTYTNGERWGQVTVAETERAAFCFSFAQLARATPDLKFYRLIQLFNTPLLSLDTRAAGRAAYGYWQGVRPSFREGEGSWAHLWFFRDGDDLMVVEYGFAGNLTLWSAVKSPAALGACFEDICREMASLADA